MGATWAGQAFLQPCGAGQHLDGPEARLATQAGPGLFSRAPEGEVGGSSLGEFSRGRTRGYVPVLAGGG